MFLMPKRDAYRVKNCHIEPITVSDHAPLVLSFDLEKSNNSKLWRLNVSILNDSEVVQNITDEWENYLKCNDNGEVSVSTLWEAAKVVMREKYLSLSHLNLKKREKENKKKFEKEISDLEHIHKRTNYESTLNSLKSSRQKLNDLLTYKAEGALRFADQKYYESGNRASRLLAIQLRKAQSNRTIAKILHPTSKKLLSHPKDIADAFSSYYEVLYNSPEDCDKSDKIKNVLEKIKLPSLTETQSKEL